MCFVFSFLVVAKDIGFGNSSEKSIFPPSSGKNADIMCYCILEPFRGTHTFSLENFNCFI